MPLMHSVKKLANNLNITILAILFVLFVFFLFPVYQAQITKIAGESIATLDGRFSYTLADVNLVFNKMTEDGRSVYRVISGVLDMFYPLIYGVLFFLLLIRATNSIPNNKFKLCSLLPLIAMLFDYIENIGVLRMLDAFPAITNSQVVFNSFITTCKWVFVFLTLISVVILAAYNFFSPKELRN
ncbi:hypothetical protein EMN47_03790 [Prolixibacteraceae bacterium JC049]|nr:hypothetical protein [Prolixibacteraceae bacterium JC049]